MPNILIASSTLYHQIVQTFLYVSRPCSELTLNLYDRFIFIFQNKKKMVFVVVNYTEIHQLYVFNCSFRELSGPPSSSPSFQPFIPHSFNDY